MSRKPDPEYPHDADHGMIAKSHPSMVRFRRVPLPWWVHNLPLLMGLSPFVVTLFFLQLWVVRETERNEPALMLLAVAGALVVAWFFAVFGTYICARLLRNDDRAALGEARNGETYVGVAYSDGFWTFRNDCAWDRGYLAVTPDGLLFRGHTTEFALPAHAIHGLRLASSRAMGNLNSPRVFIDWVSPDGARSTMSLDARSILAIGAARRANIALAERLQTVLSAPADQPIRAVWPPALSPNGFVKVSELRITRTDRVVSVLSGAASASLVLIATIFARDHLRLLSELAAPVTAGLLLIAFLLVFSFTLNRRVERRLREAAEAPVDPFPAIDPNSRIEHEPEENHQRA